MSATVGLENKVDTGLPKRNLPLLTSARFFAASAVLLYHYFDLGGDDDSHIRSHAVDPTARPVRRLLQATMPFLKDGNLAVEFFFVLSGFVLTHVYFTRYAEGRFDYVDFIRRRVARIYPLHLLMLVAFVAVGVVLSRLGTRSALFDVATIPNHLLLIHAWGFQDVGTYNNVSWSISAEWAAYLTFPIFLWLAARRGIVAMLVGTILLAIGLVVGFDGTQGLTHRTVDFGAVRIFATFPLGVASWLVFRRLVDRPPPPALAYLTTLLPVVAFVVGSVAGLPQGGLLFAMPPMVLGLALLDQSDRLRIFARPAWVYLGEISYGLYMVHMFVFRFPLVAGERVEGLAKPWIYDMLMLLAAAASLLAAHLTFRHVEQPLGRRINRIGRGTTV